MTVIGRKELAARGRALFLKLRRSFRQSNDRLADVPVASGKAEVNALSTPSGVLKGSLTRTASIHA